MNNDKNDSMMEGNDLNNSEEQKTIETFSEESQQQENQTAETSSVVDDEEMKKWENEVSGVVPQEPKTDNPGFFKKNYKKMLIGLGVIIIAIIAVILLMPTHYTAQEIADEMASTLSSNTGENHMTGITVFTADTDPNGLLGEENQYVEKSSFDDDRVDTDENSFVGTIEVFDSLQALELRKYYMDTVYSMAEEEYKQFGSYAQYGIPQIRIFTANNALLMIGSGLDDTAIDEYETAFTQVMEKNDFKDKDIMTDSELASQKETLHTQVEGLMATAVNSFKETLDGVKTDTETTVAKVEKSLNRDDLKAAHDAVDIVFEDYFTTEVKDWNSRLTKAEGKIEAAEKAARQKELDARTKTLSAGTYTVGKDIDAGLYDAIAKSGGGNFIIHNSYGSLKVNEILGVKDPDFYLRKYSNLNLETGDEIEIRSTLKVKFQAK